jgi:hypothetical protein
MPSDWTGVVAKFGKFTMHLPGWRPTCPYCAGKAELKESAEVYPNAKQDYGPVWVCDTCDARVGCHPNSDYAPMGRLANAELRRWKVKAHAAFDPLWRRDGFSRSEAYEYLRIRMGEVKPVHIGDMGVAECRQVVEICEEHRA